MTITALPFIYIGTALTIRRLRDIGLRIWAVCYFFLPFINLLFFLILSLLPSKSISADAKKEQKWLSRLIPKSNWGSAAAAVVLTDLLAVVCGAITIYVFGEYWSGLFLGIPFMQGLTAALIFGYHKPRTMGQSVTVAMSSVILFALLIFVLAMEGLLCIAMAAPLAIAIAAIGGGIGHMIQRRDEKGTPAALLVFAVLPLMSGVVHTLDIQPPLTPVTTSIHLDPNYLSHCLN